MQALEKFEASIVLNTTEDQIRSNLLVTKYRQGTRWLDVREPSNRTLVICASGPSAFNTLKNLGDPTAYDLMALNGAYWSLLWRGYIPKFYAQIDARPENVTFVKTANYNTEFLLAAQVHPDVFDDLCDCKVTTFHLATETTREIFPDHIGTFLGAGTGTVGMGAIPLAIVLGYRKIVLVGYDSSFSEGKSHMDPQPMNADQQRIQVEFRGKWYETTPILAQQVQDFHGWYRQLLKDFPDLLLHIAGEGLFYDFVAQPAEMTTKTSREEELARYPAIYAEDPDYHCTKIRLECIEKALLMVPREGLSYLDVSCGRGESLGLARSLGFEVVSGTETVPALLNESVGHGILPNLPVPDKSYDVVSLIEVIEHLVPDDVEPALRELDRIARKYIIISAATFPSWHGGANLHPSARKESEWDLLFREIWGDRVEKLPFIIHPSPAWLVRL